MYRLFSGLIFAVAVTQLGCRGGGNQSPGVILMRYNPGSQSTEQREKGFLDTLAKEFPQVKVISSDQYAGTTPEGALAKATDLLNKYGDREAGIFSPFE